MLSAPITLSDRQMFSLLGQRLKSVREQAGLSLVDVSGATGIADAMLAKLEAGARPIHVGHIVRLSACYRLSPNQLFLGLAPSAGLNVSQVDIDHLLRQFLQIDQPSRGDLFKGLVASIAAGTNGN